MSGWQSVAAYYKLWFWCIAFYPLAQRPSSYIEMDSNYANFMESYYIFNFSNFPTRVVNDFVHFNMGEFTRNFSQVGNLNAASNYLFGIEFMTAIKLMVFFFSEVLICYRSYDEMIIFKTLSPHSHSIQLIWNC